MRFPDFIYNRRYGHRDGAARSMFAARGRLDSTDILRDDHPLCISFVQVGNQIGGFRIVSLPNMCFPTRYAYFSWTTCPIAPGRNHKVSVQGLLGRGDGLDVQWNDRYVSGFLKGDVESCRVGH